MVDDSTAIDQHVAIIEDQRRDATERIGGSHLGAIVEAGDWKLLVRYPVSLERDGHAAGERRAINPDEQHLSALLHVNRAAARLIISVRRACAGAILSFMNARTSGGAVSGEPELNGGAGLYSSRSWIASAVRRSTRCDTSVS